MKLFKTLLLVMIFSLGGNVLSMGNRALSGADVTGKDKQGPVRKAFGNLLKVSPKAFKKIMFVSGSPQFQADFFLSKIMLAGQSGKGKRT